jgi:peroxiredoxin
MKHKFVVVRLLTGLLFLLLFHSIPVNAAPLKPGDKAPDFRLKNLQGKTVSLKNLTDKGPVMLVFWELECVYCYSHIKDFNALQEKYRSKGLTIAGINFLGEYADDVRTYAQDNNVKYMLLAERLNNIDVAEAYKVIGSPTIVLISPQGTILSYGYNVPDLSKWIK